MADAPDPLKAPPTILWGVLLYIGSSLVGLARALAYLQEPATPYGAGLPALFVLALVALLEFGLWSKVFAAREWARWTLVALTALRWLAAPGGDAAYVAILLVDTGAIALLLVPPTHAWFRAVARARARAALAAEAPQAPTEPRGTAP